MKEMWLKVAGFDGYEVSNLGQVRSNDRTVITKTGQHRKYVGKILGQAIDDHGYSHVCLWKGNRQTGFLVHRLVADAFLRKMEPGEEVNHDDLDKDNNSHCNIDITTHSENMSHATKNGRLAKKLTEKSVREIKFSTLWGENKNFLVDRFGVTRQAINAVIWGKSWKRVNISEWLASHD